MAVSIAAKKIIWAASRRVQRERAAALARTAKACDDESYMSRRSASAGHLDAEEGYVDTMDVLDFAKAYADLRTAAQEQVDDLLNGGEDEYEDINPNAVQLIKRSLGGYLDDLDDAISDYEGWLGAQDEDDEDDEDLRRAYRREMRGKRRL